MTVSLGKVVKGRAAVISFSKLGFGAATRLGMAASLALATACSALAQDRETWRCDTANGHFSRIALPIGDKTTSVSGRITFHKAYFGPDFGSIARIAFTDSQLPAGDCRCNGIFVKAFPDSSTVGFYMLVDGEPVELARAPYETPITFNFSLDPQGRLTARMGKTSPTSKTATPRHLKRDSVVMSCSGADLSFLNVDPQ